MTTTKDINDKLPEGYRLLDMHDYSDGFDHPKTVYKLYRKTDRLRVVATFKFLPTLAQVKRYAH